MLVSAVMLLLTVTLKLLVIPILSIVLPWVDVNSYFLYLSILALGVAMLYILHKQDQEQQMQMLKAYIRQVRDKTSEK